MKADGFTINDFARKHGMKEDLARLILSGREGFVEKGFVERIGRDVKGRALYRVTPKGIAVSGDMSTCA